MWRRARMASGTGLPQMIRLHPALLPRWSDAGPRIVPPSARHLRCRFGRVRERHCWSRDLMTGVYYKLRLQESPAFMRSKPNTLGGLL